MDNNPSDNLSINIAPMVRERIRNSISLSPVSTLIELLKDDPKKFYEEKSKFNTDNNCNQK